MDLLLKDKVIIVTGEVKGTGEDLVRLLIQEGAIPVIILSEQVHQNPFEVSPKGLPSFQVAAVSGKPEDCEKAVKAIVKTFGRIDGVVYNSCVFNGSKIQNHPSKILLEDLYHNIVYYALPELKQSKGSIILISIETSVSKQRSDHSLTLFHKEQFTLHCEREAELMANNIRVNQVKIADSFTPRYEQSGQVLALGDRNLELTSMLPSKSTLIMTEELANTVLFLLSPLSRSFIGTIELCKWSI